MRMGYPGVVRFEARFCCNLDLNGGHIAGFSGGYDGKLYALVCMGAPDDHWIKRRDPCDWRVLSVARDAYDEHVLRDQQHNFNLVQPLPAGLLLASSRCEFSDTKVIPNAHVFDLGGQIVNTLLLGDGISHLHTTSEGQTWAAYFDEGIFGSLGWKKPMGSGGLVRFNSAGNRTFEFEPSLGLSAMADCYALNVTSNSEAWCYYYTDFPIVRIWNDQVVEYWTSPVQGASTFAVWRDSVLMNSGYNSDEWALLKLRENGRSRIEEVFTFRDRSGEVLHSAAAVARGYTVWFVENGVVHDIDLRELVGGQ